MAMKKSGGKRRTTGGRRPGAGARSAGRRVTALPVECEVPEEVMQRAKDILEQWVLPCAADAVKPMKILPEANAAWFDRYWCRFGNAMWKKGQTWEKSGPAVLVMTKKIARHAALLAARHLPFKITAEDAIKASIAKECKGRAGMNAEEEQRLFWCAP